MGSNEVKSEVKNKVKNVGISEELLSACPAGGLKDVKFRCIAALAETLSILTAVNEQCPRFQASGYIYSFDKTTSRVLCSIVESSYSSWKLGDHFGAGEHTAEAACEIWLAVFLGVQSTDLGAALKHDFIKIMSVLTFKHLCRIKSFIS